LLADPNVAKSSSAAAARNAAKDEATPIDASDSTAAVENSEADPEEYVTNMSFCPNNH
jgi:hypothetical protein